MTSLDLDDIRKARRRGRSVGCLSVIAATTGLVFMFAFAPSPLLFLSTGLVTVIAIYGAWLTLVKGAELLAEVEKKIRDEE